MTGSDVPVCEYSALLTIAVFAGSKDGGTKFSFCAKNGSKLLKRGKRKSSLSVSGLSISSWTLTKRHLFKCGHSHAALDKIDTLTSLFFFLFPPAGHD